MISRYFRSKRDSNPGETFYDFCDGAIACFPPLNIIFKSEGKVIRKINEMFEEDAKEKANMSPVERLKKFKELAATIRLLIPTKIKDSSLLEVDDLLYPDADDVLAANKSRRFILTCPTPLKKLECNKWLQSYRFIYEDLASTVNSRLLDITYLQLFRYSDAEPGIPSGLLNVYEEFLKTMDATKLCLYLEMLDIGSDKLSYSVKYDKNLVMLMLTLRMIPQVKNPVRDRITSFIRKKSNLIYERNWAIGRYTLDPLMYFYGDLSPEAFDSNFIKKTYSEYRRCTTTLLKNMPIGRNFFNMLHRFFVSARNEVERNKRLKDFLQELDNQSKYDIEPYKHLIAVVDDLFELLKYALENYKRMEDVLRYIDKRNRYDITPYLSDESTNCMIREDNDYIVMNDGTKISSDSKEADYTMEKYFLYDNIMKWLHVMSILNTACKMRKDILKNVGTAFSDNEILRHNNTFIKKYLNKALIDPTQRGKMPWLIEITMKKCPFLVLPSQQGYLMEDLLKMFTFEEIDEVTEENLFMALSVPRGYKDALILNSPYSDSTISYPRSYGDNYRNNMLDMIGPRKAVADFVGLLKNISKGVIFLFVLCFSAYAFYILCLMINSSY